MFGSINLILVKANKSVTINFSVSTRHIREGKMDLNWPIKLTMSLSFILNWSQTTSFKMTSFFTSVQCVGVKRVSWGSQVLGTGSNLGNLHKNVLDAMSEPGMTSDDEKNCKYWPTLTFLRWQWGVLAGREGGGEPVRYLVSTWLFPLRLFDPLLSLGKQ